MRIRNVTTRRVSVGTPSLSIGPGETVTVDTLSGMASTELQSLISARVLVVISLFTSGNSQLDNFIGTESDEGTLDPGDVTDLTDGGDSTLHFHSADRARANHTGTQTKSTISDFTHGAADHTGAIGTLSQISDVTVPVAQLNAFTPSAGDTASRPVSPATGYMYFDTDLGKPIWWDGAMWIYSDGTAA